MDKMFQVDGKRVKTWNPFGAGCDHDCIYCYGPQQGARHKHTCALCGQFKPHFHPERLKQSLGKNNIIFVGSLSDVFGYWVEYEHLFAVINKCFTADKSNVFYFCTKNPKRYVEFFSLNPMMVASNFYFGATIETDANYPPFISKAPVIIERILAMVEFKEKFPLAHRFISMEPVMDFNPESMLMHIQRIEPEFIYCGYDNHHNDLKEPLTSKVEAFLKVAEWYTDVRRKTIREVKL